MWVSVAAYILHTAGLVWSLPGVCLIIVSHLFLDPDGLRWRAGFRCCYYYYCCYYCCYYYMYENYYYHYYSYCLYYLLHYYYYYYYMY
jgi:hypothetical protein